jgi:superoxide dismutase, Fe-Mn family
MDDKRRDFLKKSALLGLAGLAGNLVGENKLSALNDLAAKAGDGGKYSLPQLPYDYNALEPFIDAPTMQLHHGKHHQTYVDKLNAALNNYKGDQTWNGIFSQASKIDPAIRNNGGGHYNHSLFWQLMKANPKGEPNLPQGKLAEAITADFKTFDDLKKEFSEKAAKIFGSGWCWLILQDARPDDPAGRGKLKITTTPNQDNPLMDCAAEKGKPILALDVWEHAYYLKYQNKRADYISAWWNVINWQQAENQLTSK